MKLKDFGLEFPKNRSIETLSDYTFRLTEILDILLSSIGEDNLSKELRDKLNAGGDKQ